MQNILIYIYFRVRFESGNVMLEWVCDLLALCWSSSSSVSVITVADISDNVSHSKLKETKRFEDGKCLRLQIYLFCWSLQEEPVSVTEY